MNTVQLLHKQTEDTYRWVHKLIDTVPDTEWFKTPDELNTNIAWQVGHLVISLYYHTVLVIKGHQSDIMQQIPLRNYSEHYTFAGTPKDIVTIFTPEELKNHLTIIEKKSLQIINELSIDELSEGLVPGKMEHPVAQNKLEAINWNIQHTMWHCGQLAMLKRVLGDPYTFTIKKTGK